MVDFVKMYLICTFKNLYHTLGRCCIMVALNPVSRSRSQDNLSSWEIYVGNMARESLLHGSLLVFMKALILSCILVSYELGDTWGEDKPPVQ